MNIEQPGIRPASLGDLFITFTLIAMQGFGGVLAVSQRALCERKRWLTDQQYIEVLGMAQLLPGPNVCNLALIIGDRFFGWRGALTALAGITAAPLALVLVLVQLYSHYAMNPAVAGALRGVAAVAAGLIIGTGLSLLRTLRSNAMRLPACVITGVATFIAVALLHLSVSVSLVIGLLASFYAWHQVGAQSVEEKP